MHRRTYSCLAIARRHPRLFAWLTRTAHEMVTDGATQWTRWPAVDAMRAQLARERRTGPRPGEPS